MMKLSGSKIGLVLFASFAAASCVTQRFAYHSTYKLEGCSRVPTRSDLNEELIRRGYVHLADVKGPYDVFHHANIIKKGPLATEPYEDRAGDIAVAVCAGPADNYLVTEEWTSCPDRKDCTIENQKELKKLAEDWGCRVSERAGHSESWKLEDRQDWTRESCSSIASKLTF